MRNKQEHPTPNTETQATADVEFMIGAYRFRFGRSSRQGEHPLSPNIPCHSLWMWNGYYWQIEIADAHDLDGARNTMQFILSDRQAALQEAGK